MLGEPIAPAINIVPALVIRANEDFVFYGNGIQLQDIASDFERLKCEYSAFWEEKKEKKIQNSLISKVSDLKLLGRKNQLITEKKADSEILKLKNAFSDGILTQEEYERKLLETIDKIQ